MAQKKNKLPTWGLESGTIEEHYADLKRWESSLTDEQWEQLLRQGEKDICKIAAESKRKFPRLNRKRAA
ncbi:hypothetical protein PLCT1_01002 [Planctomycetaceae bacterium]|nr:hypothetical protein PLCT1_01002 [Planctomycetaceae bacterium]